MPAKKSSAKKVNPNTPRFKGKGSGLSRRDINQIGRKADAGFLGKATGNSKGAKAQRAAAGKLNKQSSSSH